MSIQDMDDLLFAIAEMSRRDRNHTLPGTVHESNKDMVRARIGLTSDGQHMLTPWIKTADQHGGALAQTLYEKDQPGHMTFTGGDIAQGVFNHAIASKAHPAPAHSGNVMNGQSSQLGKLRMAQEKSGKRNSGSSPEGEGLSGSFQNNESQNESEDTHHTYFIAKEEDKAPAFQQVSSMAAGGGSWSGDQSPAQSQKSSDAQGAFRLSEKAKGITGRWGDGDKGSRFAASDKGAQIATNKNHVVATSDMVSCNAADGDLYCAGKNTYVNKAWKIKSAKANPMKNDNDLYGKSQGGGSGGGGGGSGTTA